MRVLLGAAIVLAISFGGAIAYYILSEDSSSEARVFSKEFLSFVDKDPNKARQYIANGIDRCLPVTARGSWEGTDVKELSTDVYLKSFSLMSEDIPQEQRDQRFKEWVLQADGRLTEEQKKSFVGLMRGGLYDGKTLFCVASSVKEMLL